MTNSTLQPARFVVDGPGLAAAMHAAGVEPRSGLGLPAPASGRLPAELVVSKKLTPLATRALTILAHPDRVLRIAIGRAGMKTLAGTQLAWRAESDDFVIWTPSGDGADMAYLPSRVQAKLVIDELLGFTDLPCEEGDIGAEVPAVTYVALLAIAGVFTKRQLQARLDGTPTVDLTTVAPIDLETALTNQTGDVRNSLAAGFSDLPLTPDAFAGRMVDGLKGLADAGWTKPTSGGHHTVTEAGFSLVSNLAQTVTVATLTGRHFGDNGEAVMSPVTVFRTVTDIIGAVWNTPTVEGRVLVSQLSVTAAFGIIDDLLDASGVSAVDPSDRAAGTASAAAFCVSCGTAYPEGSYAFCTNCGLPR